MVLSPSERDSDGLICLQGAPAYHSCSRAATKYFLHKTLGRGRCSKIEGRKKKLRKVLKALVCL